MMAFLMSLGTLLGAQEEKEWELSWDFEVKANVRDSESASFPSPFPAEPRRFMQTVNEGTHFELSNASIIMGVEWSELLSGRIKLDFIDLYDRNPTSTDHRMDVDEAWIRFGRETEPGQMPEGSGFYARLGKFGKTERQNDRHLESYGLAATAFNRFEDQGIQIGGDLGRHVYFFASGTQGNPLFFRDPNVLAGDNGTEEVLILGNLNPSLKSGFPILYDAEVEDLDVDGDLELGIGLGIRFGDDDGVRMADILLWSYSRDLADTVKLNGTFYGGDLDLLLGPANSFPLPVSGHDKEEKGFNIWTYWEGFSFFGQYVDQEIAGMERTGFEAEIAWRFDLPLLWAAGGQQLFPYIAPALRYSKLDPEFAGGSSEYPAPSVRWEWEKIDIGIRLGITESVDLTLEFQDNTFVRLGRDESNDEYLMTLRWAF